MADKPRIVKNWQHGWIVEFSRAAEHGEYKSYVVGCITWRNAVHTAPEIVRVTARQKGKAQSVRG